MGWRRFLRRGWWDDERARELESYLQIETDDNVARGMAPEAARRAAERKLGSALRAREDIYRMNSLPVLDPAWQDLRYAWRLLRRTPGFSLIAMATLALGIGTVTVMYSVIQNVLLDPFPYANSRRLVDVLVYDTSRPDSFRLNLTADEFLDYQEQSGIFENVAGADTISLLYRAREGTVAIDATFVTPNTFELLGVAPLLGRVAGPADVRPGAPAVVVMSHKMWVSQFDASPAVIGQTIMVDELPRTVIGVMPPRFTWHVADIWIPQALVRGAPALRGNTRVLQAHLAPGVTIEQAEAQLNVIARRRALTHPQDYPPQFRIGVIHVIDFVVRQYRATLYTLFAAVGLLLLIACGNVANMLLARATRARER